MPLDADLLEQSILDTMEEVTPELLDNEILEVEVTEEQQPDGSTIFVDNEVRGPVQFGPRGQRAMRPLARAIARTVIDHIIAHAEVDNVSGRIT